MTPEEILTAQLQAIAEQARRATASEFCLVIAGGPDGCGAGLVVRNPKPEHLAHSKAEALSNILRVVSLLLSEIAVGAKMQVIQGGKTFAMDDFSVSHITNKLGEKP